MAAAAKTTVETAASASGHDHQRVEMCPCGLEWRVTIPEGSGSSVKMEFESGPCDALVRSAWASAAVRFVVSIVSGLFDFVRNGLKIGVEDPRKVIHGFKVGIALTLVSLFYYSKPLYEGVGGSAMWSIMTVVVVFESTVGGCLYKGINRAIATLSAGFLAVGIHWIASKFGVKVEPFVLSASVFILASAATFSRFLPAVKARFDYGVTIFILTFSLVAVSGYRVDELLEMAEHRVSTIAIGISMCLFVCILICPIWSGEELHLLITGNMVKLADSLEGCVEDYFMKDEQATDHKNESTSGGSQGYKCVLNSKASEDSLANLARWEPGHGRYGFRHPWSQYLKVGAAMRGCAYCIEAFNGCINSEIQATETVKNHLREPCMKLSSNYSEILMELSSLMKLMKKSNNVGSLVEEMNTSVDELQDALRSLPDQLSRQEEKTSTLNQAPPPRPPVVSLVEVVTAVSLLIEISERVKGIVDAFEQLATAACFEPAAEVKKP